MFLPFQLAHEPVELAQQGIRISGAVVALDIRRLASSQISLAMQRATVKHSYGLIRCVRHTVSGSGTRRWRWLVSRLPPAQVWALRPCGSCPASCAALRQFV